jgi:NTE family protein
MPTPIFVSPQFDVLRTVLSRLFGELNEETFEIIRPYLSWIELAGGDVLFQEGAVSDALYLVISGRLQATVADAAGRPKIVGDIGRGESAGEMGVFSGKPRRATVTAIRDSVLAKIELASFQAILQAVPALTLNLNRLIIERLQLSNLSQKRTRNVTNIAIVGVSAGVSVANFLQELSAELTRQKQTVVHLTSVGIDQAAGRTGAAQVSNDDPPALYWLSNYLDKLEGEFSLVFYETDSTPTEWTRRCFRQADEVLLLADAQASPELSTIELTALRGSTTRARQDLVLLHPAQAEWADGTLEFLARRPNLQRHYQVRAGNRGDLARLARFLSGHAVGLVLAGGGARGLAHAGVFRALAEAGVEVDAVGGTSMGSLLAVGLGLDWNWQRIREVSQHQAASNPTGDFNLVPLVSLLAGKRLDRSLLGLFGHRHIEEMWRPYFCVSSNFTKACEVVHTSGELRRALRASMAVPGVFPPVVSGDALLVDGGVFNNLPVDVMARMGVRKILAVDLRPEVKPSMFDFTDVPGGWTLLWDRLRGSKRRRFQIPSLLNLLVATSTLGSDQKMSQLAVDVDVLFEPNVGHFGMLEWKAFDRLFEEGYRQAREVLARHPPPY